MPSLNKVMLMGNLTKDAELRYLPSGQPLLDFRLATTRRYRLQSGEDREETLFIDVTLWGKRAEAIAQYLKRGSPIFVEGRLKLDQWEKDGQKHSKISVVAENIEFVGSRQGGAAPEGPPVEEADGSGAAPRSSYAGGANRGGGYGNGRPSYGQSRPPMAAPGGPRPEPVAAPPAVGGTVGIADDEIPF